MRVFLVRHGSALSDAEDPKRSLSPVGRREAEATARFLKRNPPAPKVRLYHSPKARARQTAEIIAEALDIPELIEDGQLLPMSDPGDWSYRLKQRKDIDVDVILVGHLPYLERLASLILTGDSERLGLVFKPAGSVCLEREQDGGFSMLWLVSPGLLS